MPKVKTKSEDFADVMTLGIERGVANNPLFINTAKNYEIIQKAILAIEKAIDNSEAIVTKNYVKDVENQYTNPAIKDLPKLIDAANKTVATLMDIINSMGNVGASDGFLEFVGGKKTVVR